MTPSPLLRRYNRRVIPVLAAAAIVISLLVGWILGRIWSWDHGVEVSSETVQWTEDEL